MRVVFPLVCLKPVNFRLVLQSYKYNLIVSLFLKHFFENLHLPPHSGHSAEVTVEAVYPIGSVYHTLYLWSIVPVCQVGLVVRIVAQQLYGPLFLSSPSPGGLAYFPSKLGKACFSARKLLYLHTKS